VEKRGRRRYWPFPGLKANTDSFLYFSLDIMVIMVIIVINGGLIWKRAYPWLKQKPRFQNASGRWKEVPP
jgi:hypothetical protein